MRDIVVVGTSAGGIQALRRLVAGLSPSLPAAVIVVMHLPLRSELVRVLTGCASFPVHWARDRMPIARHNLHLAPPDHQLSVDRGFLRVDTSPKEGVHRPSINLLFRSAAAVYGQRVIGVILTGHPSLDRATDIRASFGCNQLDAINWMQSTYHVRERNDTGAVSIEQSDQQQANLAIGHCEDRFSG